MERLSVFQFPNRFIGSRITVMGNGQEKDVE
jgi:hypothetical protein